VTIYSDPLSMQGKVAIVTGGGTGIGAETARLFVRHGAAGVVLAARTESDLAKVAAELEVIAKEVGNTGVGVLQVRTDVKSEESVISMVQQAIERFGQIDVLVNNAGGTRMGPLEDLPTRGWEATVALNMTGPFYCTREAGRHMIKAHSGAIVNISSGAGVNGVINGAGYSAAKAGLQMFTRVTAAEWGRYGIRANCIAVGAVASERATAAWEVAKLDVSQMGKGNALGRLGEPSDISYPILFLSTDASSFVTGQTFSADGGTGLGGGRSLEE
jgi:citronellol/citronellal dehydrogenase